jgi:hypothetical protein
MTSRKAIGRLEISWQPRVDSIYVASFACAAIPKDGIITSWGLPFGIALLDLQAGAYLCNLKVLRNT